MCTSKMASELRRVDASVLDAAVDLKKEKRRGARKVAGGHLVRQSAVKQSGKRGMNGLGVIEKDVLYR